MRFRSLIATAAMTAAAGAALAGCGSSGGGDHPPMAAYGQGSYCYYSYTPAEVGQLKAAGLCPQNSFPMQAPQSWLDEYYYYYDSPLYYNAYVPPQYRTAYVRTYGPKSAFYRNNRSAIATLAKKAVYRTTSGAAVTGVASTATFGSGSSFGRAGQRYSTGSLRVGSSPKATARASLPVVRSTSSRANVPGYSGYVPPAQSTPKAPAKKSTKSGKK